LRAVPVQPSPSMRESQADVCSAGVVRVSTPPGAALRGILRRTTSPLPSLPSPHHWIHPSAPYGHPPPGYAHGIWHCLAFVACRTNPMTSLATPQASACSPFEALRMAKARSSLRHATCNEVGAKGTRSFLELTFSDWALRTKCFSDPTVSLYFLKLSSY